MTSEPEGSERRRRTRAPRKPPAIPESATSDAMADAGDTVHHRSVEAPAERVVETATIPRQIFSSPAAAVAPVAGVPDPTPTAVEAPESAPSIAAPNAPRGRRSPAATTTGPRTRRKPAAAPLPEPDLDPRHHEQVAEADANRDQYAANWITVPAPADAAPAADEQAVADAEIEVPAAAPAPSLEVAPEEPRTMPKRTRRGGRRPPARVEAVEPADAPVGLESALENDLVVVSERQAGAEPALATAPAPDSSEGTPVTMAVEEGADDALFGIAARPATPEELAAIARAGGIVAHGPAPAAAAALPAAGVTDDETHALPEGNEAERARRRRRRGGRRRGRGRSEDSTSEDTPLAPSANGSTAPPVQAQPAPYAPDFPDYPVDIEPMPPPTKRRPARRRGSFETARFTRAEREEIDRFVGGRPAAGADLPLPAAGAFEATPLAPEDERALRQAQPRQPFGRRDPGLAPAGAVQGGPGQQAASSARFGAEDRAFPPAGTTLEALLARQNVILDTMLERQVTLMRGIERALTAIEQRLANGAAGAASQPRVAVFVDVPNVIYAAERVNCTIDFAKLLAMVTRGRELVRAAAYAPVSDDPQMRLETQKFVQPFVDRRYRIITKPLKRFADGTMKGNFDVEMAMDILTMADRLDVVCLVSGDGDFSRLVEMVASKGVRVEVVAFASSTSSELRATCDEYIDLGLHLREICGR